MAIERQLSEEEYKRRLKGLSEVSQASPDPILNKVGVNNTSTPATFGTKPLAASHNLTNINSTLRDNPLNENKQNTSLLADLSGESEAVRGFERQLQIPPKGSADISLPPITDPVASPLYEIADSTLSPEETERFNRTPVHGGSRARSGPGFVSRPEGGYGATRRDTGPSEEQMPRFDAPGFTGNAKAARIHSQEQQWLKAQKGAGYARGLENISQNAKTTRELLGNAASLANNQSNNATDIERNRILEEGNIREDERLSTPTQVKPDVRVIKVPDGLGGTKDEIRRDDGSGNYVRAMGEASVETPSESTTAKMMEMKGNKKYEDEYIKRFGSLPY